MATDTSICPMCRIKLVAEGDRKVCKICGYYRRDLPDMPEDMRFESSSSAFSQQNYNARPTYTSSRNTGDVKRVNGKALVVAVVIVMISMLAGILISIFSALQNNDTDDDKKPTTEQVTVGSDDKDDTKARLPESELFQLLAETLFNTPYSKVTAAQYASITYLEINRSECTIDCIVNEEKYSYSYDKGMSMSTKDLRCFKGLEVIVMEDTSLNKGDLIGLDKLTELYCENTAAEVAEMMPNPTQLIALGIYDNIGIRDLKGIGELTNLRYLYIDGSRLSDISHLSALTNLQEIEITDGDYLVDLSVLSKLENLTSIHLECKKVKNLGFVKGMKLERFSLEGSMIQDISALESSIETLEYLSLMDNSDVTDYSLIGEMHNLSQLELKVKTDAILPSFENLQKLIYVHANYFENIGCLADAKNLEEIWLEQCVMYELEDLTKLKSLAYLTINDTRNYVDSLAPLTQMKSLIYLDISDTTIFGYVEDILGIPNLEELYMDNCKVGFRFDQAPKNNKLMYWSMNNTYIYGSTREDRYDMDRNNRYVISDYGDIFKNYPNLIEVYLAGNGLKDLDFVKNIPNLVSIDVSNNYIDSLQALRGISTLRYVWCKDNTISDGYDLGENVTVFTQTSTEE